MSLENPPPTDGRQAEMFQNRLLKNFKHIRKWADREKVSCFRVYDHDIPEVPLAVDWYEGRLHLAEYVRPTSPEGDAHAPWIEGLANAAATALGVPEEDVYLKRRERQAGSSQYGRFSPKEKNPAASFVVHEAGRKFLINLSDYIDTGLFLDHRTTRGLVAERCAGASVLNLFAYTGSFSVYAATAGARQVTTVDWSNTYLDWARRNFALNKIEGRHNFVRADALEFAGQAQEKYDVIVVDPPTFSNRTDRAVFDVQRDHGRLVVRCRARLAKGGMMLFSTNFRRFKPEEPLEGFREISERTVPQDFRDRRIHRCFWLDA